MYRIYQADEGPRGNAFAVMADTKEAMRRQGFSKEEIDATLKDAMSGDYDHLQEVCQEKIDECNRRLLA